MEAERNCWTCKRRKIACDRRIPACMNCLRIGKECLGYGLRLTWPDQRDGRRKVLIVYAQPTSESVPPRQYGKQFLNFLSDDVEISKNFCSRRALMQGLAAQPARALSLHAPVLGQDATLLTYYEQVIAPMCSTTHARNGFRYKMLPIALDGQDPSRRALCSAMLAISAYHHLGSHAALPYKINALRTLSKSLTPVPSQSAETMEAQLAACMMLSMYSVFDKDEGYFNLHLDGARMILHNLCHSRPPRLISNFLLNWFLYYDVLGRFTQPFYSNDDKTNLSLLQTVKPDASLIIGLLGCSTEIFEIINHINQMRVWPVQNPDALPLPEAFQQRVALEQRLLNLSQHLDPDESSSGAAFQRRCAQSTAELYRLGALLYLQRVHPTLGDDLRRENYLEQAFATLGVLPVVTSPWPVFLVACESQDDEQRVRILEILDRMDSVRAVGNVYDMRRIIETVWKQHDLCCGGDRNEKVKWWYLVDSDVAAPWFV